MLSPAQRFGIDNPPKFPDYLAAPSAPMTEIPRAATVDVADLYSGEGVDFTLAEILTGISEMPRLPGDFRETLRSLADHPISGEINLSYLRPGEDQSSANLEFRWSHDPIEDAEFLAAKAAYEAEQAAYQAALARYREERAPYLAALAQCDAFRKESRRIQQTPEYLAYEEEYNAWEAKEALRKEIEALRERLATLEKDFLTHL